MDLNQIRGEFEVLVVDSENSTRELLFDSLTGRGYKVETFASAEDALQRIESNPPHVILSSHHLVGMSGMELLGRVRALSADMQFIFMTTFADIDNAMESIRQGAYDYIYKPFEDIGEVNIAVDHVVEKIYLQFQNEQLHSELKDKKRTVKKAKSKIRKEREDQGQIWRLMSQLTEAQDVIQVFLDETSRVLGDTPVLFFKLLPAHFTLAVTHSSVVPMAQLRGIGLNLKDQIDNDYLEALKNPKTMKSLEQLVFEVFGSNGYEAFPIETEEGIAGLILTLKPIDDASQRRLFETQIQLFQVYYANSVLKKLLHSQSIRDSLTGTLNKKAFGQKILEEISRARRIEMPVSMISVGVDHFSEFVENNGPALGDIVLKMLSSLIKRTSRIIDVVGRTGPAEFAILLPHTSQTGAAIKAEKLRKLVELTKFPQRETQPGGKITVSMGISEYPTLANDAESLVQTSDSAYFQVRDVTNKVCLAAPLPGLKPDFETST